MKQPVEKNIILWSIMIIFSLTTLYSIAEPSAKEKTTVEDVKKEMKELAGVITTYSAEQRDKAVQQVKISLEKLDAHIDNLEDRYHKKSTQMNKDIRQTTVAALKALRKKRNAVAEWYGGMKHSSTNAWQSVKAGFLESYDILRNSFEKAQSEF